VNCGPYATQAIRTLNRTFRSIVPKTLSQTTTTARMDRETPIRPSLGTCSYRRRSRTDAGRWQQRAGEDRRGAFTASTPPPWPARPALTPPV
jgi:hypothetical protein